MADGPSVRELVDELLATKKSLAGIPESRPPNRMNEEVRWRWPVQVGGVASDCSVVAILFPNEPDLRFSVNFLFRSRSVWRIDYLPMSRVEHNPLFEGHKYSLSAIAGPHCHRWEDNRLLVPKNQLPMALPFRVPLEMPQTQIDGSHRWEKVFRHFLGSTNIGQPRTSIVPAWPAPGSLLV